MSSLPTTRSSAAVSPVGPFIGGRRSVYSPGATLGNVNLPSRIGDDELIITFITGPSLRDCISITAPLETMAPLESTIDPDTRTVATGTSDIATSDTF